MSAVDRVDGFQRRHPVVSMPIGVVYKFFDDQGNLLAATLTYYAFVAIFPLMLLGTSILGLVLRGFPGWQEEILDSALSQFPIIGDELGRPQGLSGTLVGVTVGLLAALYGAMGLGQSLQNVMHVAWSVPRNRRPNPFMSRLKTLGLLIISGGALLGVTVTASVVTRLEVFGGLVDTVLRTTLPVATVVVVGTGVTTLFQMATTSTHSFGTFAPGGYLLAVLWQLLQEGGATYVENVLVGTSSMTKTFGLVLGLVGFIFIGAVMTVFAVEVNVVLARRLYPRALLTPFTDAVDLTHADRRAYASYARAQRHKGFERVAVHFESRPDPDEEEAGTDEPPAADTAHTSQRRDDPA
jgi:membrane protein